MKGQQRAFSALGHLRPAISMLVIAKQMMEPSRPR